MLKKDLLNLINSIGDDQEVDETLKDSELVKKFSSLDTFKEKINNDKDFKAFMDSEKDKHSSKSLETWKSNNLTKLIEEEIKKRNPTNLDEKDLKIQELQKKFEEMERQTNKKDLELEVSKLATEKNIPVDLIPYILDTNLDKEATLNNFSVLEKALGEYSKVVRQQIIQSGSYTPHKSTGGNTTINPYAKATWSMTQQMELERTNPDLARQFKSQVGL